MRYIPSDGCEVNVVTEEAKKKQYGDEVAIQHSLIGTLRERERGEREGAITRVR